MDLWPLVWIAGIVAGFVVLNQGAKFLTDNAAAVGRRNRMGDFAIGVLLVSVLAAVPELLVSVLALTEGSPQLALGNALSSQVVAISFVIGLAAMLAPIKSTREVVLRDALFLATFSVVAAALLLDGTLAFFDGIALVVLFVPYTINLLLVQRTGKPEELLQVAEEARVELLFSGWIFGKRREVRAGLPWLVFGVLWAVMGAQFIVRSAVALSVTFGVSEWVIGITAVGLGTSLPDIAAAVHATRRGYTDLALGAGIGASISTILLDLGVIGLLWPSTVSLPAVLPMVVAMVGGTFLLVALMFGRWRITRASGALLFSVYFLAVAASLLGMAVQ
ncbi:MAG TPA: sodium:calcium antiporter [Thermoplasmata archaeon]|nr:sodium:calcium antiporter [Thermoplasmata archaeon]